MGTQRQDNPFDFSDSPARPRSQEGGSPVKRPGAAAPRPPRRTHLIWAACAGITAIIGIIAVTVWLVAGARVESPKPTPTARVAQPKTKPKPTAPILRVAED